MKLKDLKEEQRFRFPGQEAEFVARGGNFYSSPLGYDGGPWNSDGETEVLLVPEAEQTKYIDTNGQPVCEQVLCRTDNVKTTFLLTVRSLNFTDVQEIINLLQIRYEVTDAKMVGRTVVVKRLD